MIKSLFMEFRVSGCEYTNLKLETIFMTIFSLAHHVIHFCGGIRMKRFRLRTIFLGMLVLCAMAGYTAQALASEPIKAQTAGKNPLETVGVYLDGFHFRNGDIHQQVEAHHYCTSLSEDLIQCVVYDGNGPDAILMGVEYVISEKLFKTLPMDEKKLWHSHHYEVKAGQLAAPNLSDSAEHELMAKLVSTYGKTWHTWRMDQMGKGVPLGIPELMMGFTADGQGKPDLLEERDKRFGISTENKAKERADIPMPTLQPGANAWEKGEVVQLELKPLK